VRRCYRFPGLPALAPSLGRRDAAAMAPTRAAAIFVAMATILLFATPLRALWARDDGPWWLPFAVWAPLVVVLARTLRDRGAP
jgi:hypothetical protein